MTLTNRMWATGIALVSTWFGISVMLGFIPGLDSEIGTFARIAALTKMAVDEYGRFLAGFGAIVSGMILAALCLVSGKGSPDSGLGID